MLVIYFGKQSLKRKSEYLWKKKQSKREKQTQWYIFKLIPTVGIWNLIMLGTFAEACNMHFINVCPGQRKRGIYLLAPVPPSVRRSMTWNSRFIHDSVSRWYLPRSLKICDRNMPWDRKEEKVDAAEPDAVTLHLWEAGHHKN